MGAGVFWTGSKRGSRDPGDSNPQMIPGVGSRANNSARGEQEMGKPGSGMRRISWAFTLRGGKACQGRREYRCRFYQKKAGGPGGGGGVERAVGGGQLFRVSQPQTPVLNKRELLLLSLLGAVMSSLALHFCRNRNSLEMLNHTD